MGPEVMADGEGKPCHRGGRGIESDVGLDSNYCPPRMTTIRVRQSKLCISQNHDIQTAGLTRHLSDFAHKRSSIGSVTMNSPFGTSAGRTLSQNSQNESVIQKEDTCDSCTPSRLRFEEHYLRSIRSDSVSVIK